MPAGSNGWDEAAAKFNAGPYPFRHAEGIKRKFYTLRNHEKPTGDPSCPVDVVRAKYISRPIDANCAVLPWKTTRTTWTTTVMAMGNDYASEQDECQVKMNEVPLPASRHERPSRSGMGESELAMLGSRLKRAASAPPSGVYPRVCGEETRQSIDKFIDGAMVPDAKASSDMKSMTMLMGVRAAQREEKRLDKVLEWRQQQQEREERVQRDRSERDAQPDEMQLMLFTKLFGNN
ncbi:hypothetical protein H257_09312 [Aphanomyces astaci]|uniref:DUF6818 domain-containing protein n=1 Tax=Aphanomyces astaci TaxID=112090 RepID=W4GCR6_APHAT|nr:hypothetical protein H257_09312 [Aphanomyces astaci]ETV76874.1 hypothetical protein H257_09312 [Aphanomyces astaci]|eukprot:XP_009833786.1 hypothetical protein H257_09312 [Aphanomyces astaci]